MSFPTVYYITQVIPSCYSAGYAMCVCVSFGACVYRSLDSVLTGDVNAHSTLWHSYTDDHREQLIADVIFFNRKNLLKIKILQKKYKQN